MSLYTIGVDVSKSKFDVCILDEDLKPCYMSFRNDATGIVDCLAALKSFAISRIVCEPTGGYERDLCLQLLANNYSVHRVHTIKFASFAKSLGYVKTDKKDAYKLALYGLKFAVVGNYNYEVVQDHIKQLVQRREYYITLLCNAKRQRSRANDAFLKEDIEHHIQRLDQQIKRLDCKIQSVIDAHPELKKRQDRLCTAPGIGDITARKLIAHLPELGNASIKWEQLSALIGIAPYTRASGGWNGRAYTRGGRKIPRDALYVAAFTGVRQIPCLKDLAQRLSAKGKAKKLIRVAAMRKLLGILHSMLRQDRDFITQIN